MALRLWQALGLVLIAAQVACCAEDSGQNKQDEVVMRLWDGPAPLARGKTPADIPTLTLRRPPRETSNGTAVVICPGGGYGTLVTSYEGEEVAHWLTSLGVTTFVLHYRVAPYQHPAPLIDVQRAIRTVRASAQELGIDPQRVGIIGFSAGGHLASTAATRFDDEPVPPADEIDRLSARPDFAIMAYPVISMEQGVTHAGSRKRLLGANPDPALVESLSTDRAVTKQTPPVFLFHTAADTAVPAENSIRFFRACLKAGVPAELHVFEHGKHGVGLAQDEPGLKMWPSLCEAWMTRHGWLPAVGAGEAGDRGDEN